MLIRKAQKTETDCGLVFTLSNDPVVRSNSFNTDRIEYSSHVQWYETVVSDINILFFLVFDGDDFVGQIRFNRKTQQAGECVISLSIVEQFRGKGLALDFMELGIKELKENWSEIKKIVAEVKAENSASNRLFKAAGFMQIMAGTVNVYKMDFK